LYSRHRTAARFQRRFASGPILTALLGHFFNEPQFLGHVGLNAHLRLTQGGRLRCQKRFGSCILLRREQDPIARGNILPTMSGVE